MTADAFTPKTKYPRAVAMEVFLELRGFFEGRCARLVAAGSFRRRRAEVGDLELVFVPKVVQAADPEDLLGGMMATDDTARLCEELLARGTLAKRLNEKGSCTWGAQNKLAVHVASGLPIDLFATTEANWANYLVCRTGGAATNKAICHAAIRQGLKWCPYAAGFVKAPQTDWDAAPSADRLTARSERGVFATVGLEYREPWERE